MKIRIFHRLRADWLYIGCPTDTVRIKTYSVRIRDLYDLSRGMSIEVYL